MTASAPPDSDHNRPELRLAIVVTRPITADYLLEGQLAELVRLGYKVWLITSPDPGLERIAQRESVNVVPVPMRRAIHPWSDLISLVRMTWVLGRIRPQLVNASTPKAGLLGTVAALLVGVPNRVYTVRGLRLETARGLRRLLLRLGETVSCAAATRIVCVSSSLAGELRRHGLARGRELRVLGAGSSNGVDGKRFRPAIPAEGAPPGVDCPPEARVIGFVGRLTRDKGLADLAEAYFDHLQPRWEAAHLLLVGDFELDDAVEPEVRALLRGDPRVHITGFRSDVHALYRQMDVLVLPSYREGFPNAVLEASASAIPVVAYDATGSRDAIEDGVTGVLVPVGDRYGLAHAIGRYLEAPELREQHGRAGRRRALEHFSRERVWSAWRDFYRETLSASGPAGKEAA